MNDKGCNMQKERAALRWNISNYTLDPEGMNKSAIVNSIYGWQQFNATY